MPPRLRAWHWLRASSGQYSPETPPSAPAPAEERSAIPWRLKYNVANIKDSLGKLMEVDGAVAAAVVDAESGLTLGKEGSGIDLDLAAAGNTEVVRAKLKTMKSLNLSDAIEDILITLSMQYHIIRPVESASGLFIYLVLHKERSNLALARRKVADVEGELTV